MKAQIGCTRDGWWKKIMSHEDTGYLTASDERWLRETVNITQSS